MRASELAGVPFLFYPEGTVLRNLIDRFFDRIGVSPDVVMEADDTEAITRLVESGFGYSIIPEHALRQRTRSIRSYRVEKHPIRRSLALAMVQTVYPRKLTLSIADSLKKLLLADLDELIRVRLRLPCGPEEFAKFCGLLRFLFLPYRNPFAR